MSDSHEPLATLLSGPCPAFDMALLGIAAEFRGVDRDAALEQLDSLALPLFGVSSLGVGEALSVLAAELGGPGGLRAGSPGSLDGLWLDRVLETRKGHPALLAVVYVEIARRAGMGLALASTPHGWYVGAADGDTAIVIDPTGGPPPVDDDDDESLELRRHCAHEVAYAVLGGIAARYRRDGDARAARRAAGLRMLLPISDSLRAELRQGLDALDG